MKKEEIIKTFYKKIKRMKKYNSIETEKLVTELVVGLRCSKIQFKSLENKK